MSASASPGVRDSASESPACPPRASHIPFFERLRGAARPQWIRAIAGNCVAILLHTSALGRIRLLLTYLRLAFKGKFLVEMAGVRITKERIFSHTIYFGTYKALLILFEEIFITGIYHFDSETASPQILDAGANIGMAVAYFKTIYPKCRITAFEPDPANFEVLRRNVECNRWSGVELNNVALYDSDGVAPFFDYNDAPGALSNGLWQPTEAGPARKVINVRTALLSRYIAGPVEMLKMDIEGSEHRVMEELARNGALRAIKRITMEYHHHVRPEENRLAGMLRLLEDAGFGYHIRAPLALPFPQEAAQNFMLRAYQARPSTGA